MDYLRSRVDAECVLGGGALVFDVVELVTLVNKYLWLCVLHSLFWKLDKLSKDLVFFLSYSTFEFVTMSRSRVTLVLGF